MFVCSDDGDSLSPPPGGEGAGFGARESLLVIIPNINHYKHILHTFLHTHTFNSPKNERRNIVKSLITIEFFGGIDKVFCMGTRISTLSWCAGTPTPLILALGRQRHVDLCEFEAVLFYKMSPGQPGYTEKACLKNKTKHHLNP